jgi:hypothetical protein
MRSANANTAIRRVMLGEGDCARSPTALTSVYLP